jgi:hypothetical protein
LLFEDKNENERRLKMMRQNYHQSLVDRQQSKEKKIGEMKRIWLNHEKQPVETLYGSLHG